MSDRPVITRPAPLLIAAVLALFLEACATPASRIERLAVRHGYVRLDLPGQGFDHVAYFKPGNPGPVLHVYVEHDGTPWSTPTAPAGDPTPTHPVALELMAQDDAPALYLGRPCYFGLARAPPCEPVWWTHRRFSRRVVDSMDAALVSFLATHRGYDSLQFFGYSGGGVIATLMAADFPQTTRLVTVAAPLDVDGWATHHGYTRLEGSINPTLEPPLSPAIAQLHVVGDADDVVPASLVNPGRRAADRSRSPQRRTVHALLLLGANMEGSRPCCGTDPRARVPSISERAASPRQLL